MCDVVTGLELQLDAERNVTLKWISNLQSQYFAMVPVRHVEWMEKEWTDDHSWQLLVMAGTINHPLSHLYPPRLSYRRIFLKTLIEMCEAKLCEVNEDLYNAYFALLKEINEDVKCYKTHFVDSSLRVTVKESTRLISNGTTGLRTWEAAFALAEWCIAHKEDLFQRNVLELGCGSGFTGLVVVQVCQPSVYCFTDTHNDVLDQLLENINLNCSSSQVTHKDVEKDECEKGSVSQRLERVQIASTEVSVVALDWSKNTIALLEDFDIILASDVVYDASIIPDLVRVLLQFLHCDNNGTKVAYIACTVRNEDTLNHFLTALEANKIAYMEIKEILPQVFYYERSVPVKLWKLTKLS